MTSDYYFKQVISRLLNPGNQIKVPKDFPMQMVKINELLDNDYTGIVSTIIEFMISSGTVDMNFVTDNQKLTEILNDWSIHKLNNNISLDIPKGLKALTSQYLRERYKSSFIVLNISWSKINGLILPDKMWFVDGSAVIVDGSNSNLDGKKYFLSDEDNELKSSSKTTVLIRKPFNSWYEDYPTPYLVQRGILYNALLKKSLIEKQATVVEEMIPYILALRAGDANLLMKGAMGDIEKQLTDVKEGLKQAKRNKKYQQDSGDMILKGRYDLQVEHLIPDLTKLFNDSIIRPINNDLLCGLGLVELQGFSSDRQEAILNPKVLVEEIINGVNDAKALYEEVLDLIIEKNSELHPKHMGQDMRIVPGVVKAFLTDNMRKLIKDHVNTGILSIEDAFEGLPQGYDFEISKKRRQQEATNGDEELFFPRVILNQDSNLRDDTNTGRPITPNEIPKKKKKDVKADDEYLEAPYSNNEQLPPSVKDALPAHAQDIFRNAFNSAYKSGKSEESCFKIAWSAVKKIYKKVGDKWVKREANEGIENE
jgi:cation transport regulator